MDVAYRCNRCGRIVYRYQILYGSHRCRKCGSRRVEPIMEDLTKFGIFYCTNRNDLGEWWYRWKR